MEVATGVPPAKMFQAFVLDSDTLIPKILPQAIKSVEILEGDGGAGTIKQINFGQGNCSQFKTVRNRIDEIDKENFSYSYTVMEGDALMNTVEKICNEIKIEATSNGGSICKNKCTYYTIGDIEIKEEEIKAGKEKALAIFRAIEEYILHYPNPYK
ncbi:hypothetical protein COLO4_34686 [Corchorus olitorius]|uniref:Bet v I/Major latex protein domain-containing protein n=1 Tax=Corchorus olitorius TaxID=93759 RepID=A0A1R3GK50_9ROSI|nr:hypothetical protein COLO4_34686 [Corchorus olitorius]